MAKPIADDETRMAKFGNLTPDEKRKERAKQKAELESATDERERPLGKRVMDKLGAAFGQEANQKANEQAAAEDIARRESRYQTAKQRAGMSDQELEKEPSLYATDRVLKLKDNPLKMAKGGAVKKMAKGGSASSRADGCAQRGKTKGRFV
jgi:hypothetical protein